MIHISENTWNLCIYITDLGVERHLRVRGDTHIGGIMLQIVDPEHPKDWSDHALWWPEKNIWLTHTKSTLDQVGVQADCLLHFTPMHKVLRVQMPDLRCIECLVDFSIKTFSAVVNLCKQLGIRYPEELSFCKPLEAEYLKKNFIEFFTMKNIPIAEPDGITYLRPALDTNSFIPLEASYHHQHPNNLRNASSNSLDRSQNNNYICAPMMTPKKPNTAPGTPCGSPTSSWKYNARRFNIFDSPSFHYGDFSENLAESIQINTEDIQKRIVRPKSLTEKARLNIGWLDSSLSVMEQGIREYDMLCLRFKYYTFYDINPKYDQVRINQLYEQAKWSILAEELDYTDEEALMFSALQFQINHAKNMNSEYLSSTGRQYGSSSGDDDDDNDIDSALKELQITLEGSGSNIGNNNITQIPELYDYLRFLRPKRFTMRSYRRYFFVYRDLQLHLYKSAEESRRKAATIIINLHGCEVTPDVTLSQGKYGIRLEIPSQNNNGPNSEVCIRCDTEEQYAKWMAACQLASKGRSLADSSYDFEVANIQTLLNLQKPMYDATINIDPRTIDAREYLAQKLLRKFGNKACYRILEAHTNVRQLSVMEAKLKYIQAWQSLPGFGVSLFIIKFDGHKKEELLGVAHNRIMHMDLNTGDHIKTWRYSNMKAWNINWGVKCMMIQFHDENIVFSCLSADCKVVHEFIGGYIFMSMRSKECNQTLNEELFHKLTGGWV